MHKAFSSAADVEWAAEGCRTAGIGCLDCKKVVAENMAAELAPVREKYHELASDPDRVRALMAEGAQSARAVAVQTMEEVRHKAGLR